MKNNFEAALAQALKWEGSKFTDDPDDRGGATRYGVTQARFNQYLRDNGLAARSVRYIKTEEVKAIYKRYYWDANRCDELPAVVDVVLFDAVVNHGPGNAVPWLQKLVGATPDGALGPKTIAAATAATADAGTNQERALATRFCDRREQFYEDIAHGNQRKYLKGWMNRLDDLRKLYGLKDTDGVGK